MKRLKLSTNNHKEIITEACKVLKSGGIIVFPTETCYGLGVDATNPEAVRKLFHYKGRREGKPLSIAVTGEEMASQYVVINDIAKNLYTNYLPGPITVVSKGLQQVAQGVESEYGTLGIRIPDYQLVLDLLSSYGKPITATSANPSFGKKPYSIDALLNDLSDKKREMIDLAIDAGDLPKRKSSTVVDTTLNNLNVLREGAKKFQDATSEKDLILQAETYSPGETSDFGTMVMLKYIDIPLKRPLVLLLKGELGAGKTHFVKGLAKELKIVDDITSPTYTIIDEYNYTLGTRSGYFVHMDTWRMESNEEFKSVGLEEYYKPGNIIAVEWADKFMDEFKQYNKEYGAYVLNISFKYSKTNSRIIKVYS